MLIEWLKVRVSPELREKYIRTDEEIWTAFLATCPGFLGKEVWINPDRPSEIIMVIRWASREEWKSIPQDRLEEVERKFDQTFGDAVPIIESGEYQVRKFPSTQGNS